MKNYAMIAVKQRLNVLEMTHAGRVENLQTAERRLLYARNELDEANDEMIALHAFIKANKV